MPSVSQFLNELMKTLSGSTLSLSTQVLINGYRPNVYKEINKILDEFGVGGGGGVVI